MDKTDKPFWEDKETLLLEAPPTPTSLQLQDKIALKTRQETYKKASPVIPKKTKWTGVLFEDIFDGEFLFISAVFCWITLLV